MLFAVAHDGFSTPDYLALLKARDETALQRLVNSYLPQILRAARGAGLNHQNAEDVCQSTFVTFIEKNRHLRGPFSRAHLAVWDPVS